MNTSYVLITPARNEEAFIEKTIQSVISQTILPQTWVIVSDGSIDRTEEIVHRYTLLYNFIQLIQIKSNENRNFSSKARAFNTGYTILENVDYEFIGNLDADISFESNYFEKILSEFDKNPKLGIAGGIISELINGKYFDQRISLNSVAGAVQLFRRQCYEDIGGYVPLTSGGIDSAAEIMARMHGWTVQTFKEIKVLHHRRVGTVKRNLLKSIFNKGVINYSLGYHPLFQIVISMYRSTKKPYFIGGILMLCGYLWAFYRRDYRPLTDEVIKFLRAEQMKRIGLKFLTE